MAGTSKTGLFKTNYVKFGRNERYVPEIFDKKQQNQNFTNNKKEENPKEEVSTSNFIDRSSQLSGSLNSLALSNMVNLRRFEKTSRSKVDVIIDEKIGIKTEILNPFAQKS